MEMMRYVVGIHSSYISLLILHVNLLCIDKKYISS